MENRRYNNKRRPPPKRFKIKVFDTRKGSRRSFIHEGLRYWEVDYIRFHPYLKVKILEVT